MFFGPLTAPASRILLHALERRVFQYLVENVFVVGEQTLGINFGI